MPPADDVHLKNAPVIEAIFEISASTSKDWESLEDFKRSTRGLLDQNTFPDSVEHHSQGFQIAAKSENVPKIQVGPANWEFVEYRGINQVVRLRSDGLSVHQLPPYGRYEDTVSFVKDLWIKYTRLCEVVTVPKIVLRYINRFTLPPETNRDSLAAYLENVPQNALSSDLTELNTVLTQTQLTHRQTDHQAQITLRVSDENTAAAVQVILDIQTTAQPVFSPSSDGLWDTFDQLRAWKNELFFASLTPICLSLFE